MDFLLGIIGVLVGSASQAAFEHCRHMYETKAQRDLDERRKALLKAALESPPNGSEWRKLETLSRIVGANYETTTRLLIELGARGSELDNDVWALLSDKPLRNAR